MRRLVARLVFVIDDRVMDRLKLVDGTLGWLRSNRNRLKRNDVGVVQIVVTRL